MNPALLSGVLLLCGAYSILLIPVLPPTVMLPVAGVLFCWCAARKRLRRLSLVLLGFVLVWMDAASVTRQKLDPALAGGDLTVSVRVVEFPDRRADSIRMIASPLHSREVPDRIRLSWYDAAETPQFGECWRLTVRIRRPRGFSNPGTFDYEGWLFRKRIGATGYVRSGHRIDDCGADGFSDRLRRKVAARLSTVLPDDDATAVMLAITVGARHRISAAQWQRYAATGTSHLMAISGMHIGLAAGSAYLLAWCGLSIARRSGNHRIAAALIALLVAFAYAMLSGFAVPARRALTMLALGVIGIVARRSVPPAQFLGVACLLVAVTSPLDVFSPGFKLSFAAVAILLLVARRSAEAGTGKPSIAGRVAGFVRELTAVQFALLFGLLPLTAVLFGRAAWLAPAVNLLVLPIFNLITVPAALLGLLLDGPLQALGDRLLVIGWYSVGLMLDIVETAGRMPRAELPVARLSGTTLVVACLATLWVLLPVGWPGRRLAWLAAAATVLHSPARPPPDCADIHVLDVGQGLASVVVTHKHVLVFDTGPAFRSGTDTARLVVTPFLRGLGVAQLDLLVVSHADLDHAGGLRSLDSVWDIGAVLAGEPLQQVRGPQFQCRAGQLWHWDGVTFAVLHPGEGAPSNGNNASCVIEVRIAGHRALLTGDIEAAAERHLLRAAMLSPADLVLIPHHGSLSSSGHRFVAALTPQVAVASAGFGNRWRMPRPEVVERWRASGATVYDTASDGALSFRLCADSGLELTARQRADVRKIWHEP